MAAAALDSIPPAPAFFLTTYSSPEQIMPRVTQPDEIAKLKGSDKSNPDRYKNKVPKSELPLGEPPKHLTDAAAECWWKLSFYMIPGVSTGADRVLLESLSNLLAEYRKSPDDMQTTRISQMINCLGRFGMSPSDRTKLRQPLKPKDNPFARLDD